MHTKRLKKASKYLLYIIVVLLLLALLGMLLLQLPTVQTKIVNKVNHTLSQKLGNHVSIQSVDIDFFNNLDLKGVYIEDLNKDTLAMISHLNADLSILDLLKNELRIQRIDIEGAIFHLKKDASSASYNYQFLIDAFAPADKNEESTFVLDIDDINLTQTQFKLEKGNDLLEVRLAKGKIRIDEFNLKTKILKVDEILLETADLNYNYAEQHNQSKVALLFPSIPFDIEVNDFTIVDSKIVAHKNDSSLSKGTFAADNIELVDFQFQANDLVLNDKRIAGQLTNLSALDHSGFELNQLKTEFEIMDTELSIQNFELQSSKSNISTSTRISFSEFSDLQNIDKISIETDFKQTRIAMSDLRPFASYLPKGILKTDVDLSSITIHGKAKGDLRKLDLTHFTLRMPGVIEAQIEGSLAHLKNKDKFEFDIQLDRLKTSAAKLSKVLPSATLPQSLNAFGDIDLVGNFKGNVQSFDLDEVNLLTSAKTSAILSGTIQHVDNPKEMYLDLDIKQLHTHVDDIKGLIKGNLPPALKDVGNINYIGKYKGSLKDFEVKGKLGTDIGLADMDVNMKFNSAYKDADYNGEIALDKFDLGAVLNNEDFGTISLHLVAKGAGLKLEGLASEVNAQVSSFTYKEVEYQNFDFKGSIVDKKIDGDFNINNTHAKASFKGILDLQDEIPNMNFQLDVDTLALKPLNFSTRDIALSGQTQVIGKGKSVDDFIGHINIHDLHLSNDTLNYHTDTLVLETTQQNTDQKSLYLHSDDIDAQVSGHFSISQLPIYINNVVDTYIPVDWFDKPTLDENKTLDTAQVFTANVQIENEDLLHLFLPQLSNLDTLDLKARINSEKDSLLINGTIASISYANISTENISLRTNTKQHTIENKIQFDNLSGIAKLAFPRSTINAVLQKDSLLVDLNVTSDSLENILSLGGGLSNEDAVYEFNFYDELRLDGAVWNITKNNSVRFAKNYLEVDSFYIFKGNQALSIQSKNKGQSESAALDVNINNFDIHELSNLMALQNDYIFGIANGQFTLSDLFTNPNYSGDLTVNDVILKTNTLGDFKVKATKRLATKILDIDMSLLGSKNKFDANGYIDLSSKQINFDVDVDRLALLVLEPFLKKIVSQSEGSLSAKFKVDGTINKPIVNGDIHTNQLSTLVEFSKMRYQINNQDIKISDSKFEFAGVSIQDEAGRNALIKGYINHKSFKQLYYDLTIDTEAFQFLNTTVEDNPLFYGDLFMNASISVTGPLKLPKLEIDATSLSGSKFFLSPFIDSDNVSQDDYIIFTDKNFSTRDTTLVDIYKLNNKLPLALDLNLSLNEDTEFQFIIDPKSGDHLSCFGNSNLQVKLSPSGQIDVYGTYIVDKGKYNFSYGKHIKKEFDLIPGGIVSFQGDPLFARFNVKAAYNTKATPFALVQDDNSLTDSEIIQLKKRTDFQIGLNISGNITKPDLNFDLDFPSSTLNVNGTLDRKLTEIRANKEELYNQVFGILLFDSFISPNNATIGINTGSNFVLKSVSNFVENRLSTIANKYIKGVDVIVNVDSYNDDFISEDKTTSVTELGLGFSKSLFNDRLSIKALGNVDVDNRSNSANFAGIAGDFLLEYKFNDKGNFTLTVFRKSDFDVLLEENSNKNGVGLSIKKNLRLRSKNKKTNVN